VDDGGFGGVVALFLEDQSPTGKEQVFRLLFFSADWDVLRGRQDASRKQMPLWRLGLLKSKAGWRIICQSLTT
jgi:hypothetical protein